jgi:hypothetical protein
MKKQLLFIPIYYFLVINSLVTYGQEITQKEVPKQVIDLLNQYLDILSKSKSLDECAKNVFPISGGGLLNQALTEIASNIKPYSLKKDFDNVKFYQVPAKITRVLLKKGKYDGFGPTLIEGDIYKIWIAKKEGVAGMPAPIPIIVPTKSPDKPKLVTSIGSL